MNKQSVCLLLIDMENRMINRNQNEEFKSKENCCSSVSTYLIKNYPDIPLQKFDSYTTAKEAFENGTSVAWANDSHQRK